MKQNETSDQKALESINDEIFHSFDPDDASWIIGGRTKMTRLLTFSSDGSTFDVLFD
jgi:hypothetical protein